MKTYIHTYILDHISLIYSSNSCTDNQNTYFVLNNLSLKIRAVYEILWQNMVKQGRPQMTIKYGACALHATNAHSECYTYSFSTATMASRTPFNAMQHVHNLS